ncbi:MAG: alpha/beta hydrolase [Kofleriaceae bacterium]
MPRYLVVPGWNGSGPNHWQSHLEQSLAGTTRVEMSDWQAPNPAHWVSTLERYIAQGEPPIVIGHSLGCVAVAHAVANGARIRAALLVAPADVERPNCARVLQTFAPIPKPRFNVPVTTVGSDNDVHASIEKVRDLSKAWGAELVVVPGGGHLNVASGHGPWPLAQLLAQQLASVTHDARVA